MTPAPSLPPAPAHGPEDADALFDWALGRACAGFVLRSVRRHWLLGLGSFAAVLSVALLALLALPRTWHTEVKILTARNQVMIGLANPERAVPREADAPTQAASELILQHANLVALVKQTNLLDLWDASRAPAVAAKDWVVWLFKGAPSEEDRLNALVGVLEKRMKVTTDVSGTVTIDIEWPDAQMAYQLVEAAQQNFIETRHAIEVSTITEAISIIEWHASSMGESVQSILDELRRARQAATPAPKPGDKASPRRPSAAAAASAPAAPARARPVDQELAQAKAMLAARQRALGDLEDYRRKRLAELQAQLTEQRATYADAHPLVVASQESIAALSKDSPQTESLKREVKDLEREVAARTPREEPGPGEAAPSAAPRGPAADARPEAVFAEARREVAAGPERNEDPSVEYLREQLKVAISKHQDLLGRVDGARIELDAARAAFKYRYSVVRPAQVPKDPVKPKPAAVLGGGSFAALLFALFACVAADLRAGRIHEAWQVEKLLGVPVLAEVRRP